METFTDADGTWPVVEWRVYYRHDVYCSCRGDTPADLPENGVQVVAWFYRKDGAVRCQLLSGYEADPTIYRVGGRELIGTLIPDDEWNEVEARAWNECAERMKVLRGKE